MNRYLVMICMAIVAAMVAATLWFQHRARVEKARAEVAVAQAQAEQRARAIASRQPQRAIGHQLLGDVAWARGDLPAAKEAFRQAHKVQPSTATLLNLHSAVLRQDGAKAAIALVEQWLKAQPGGRVAARRPNLPRLIGMDGNPGVA